MAVKKQSFEEAMGRLEAIVAQLEKGEKEERAVAIIGTTVFGAGDKKIGTLASTANHFVYVNGVKATKADGTAYTFKDSDKTPAKIFVGDVNALYLVDDDDLKNYTDLYFKTRPAVMRIMVDNYDDLVQSAKESDKTPVLSEIDYQITQFVEKYGGVISQVEKDRYNVVFEDKYMQQIIQNRLDILDKIGRASCRERV